MFDGDAVSSCPPFEGMFGLHCFGSTGANLVRDIHQFSALVNEHTCNVVFLLESLSFCDWNEPSDRRVYHVHRDNISWSFCLSSDGW